MNDAYINHLMLCKECFAPAGRYCDEGKEHKVLSDAEYVVSLDKVEQRRMVMASLKKADPSLYPRLEHHVKAMFAERVKSRGAV